MKYSLLRKFSFQVKICNLFFKIRKFCLQYGASLFYTSVKEDKNCDLLYKYLVHRIFNFPFKVNRTGQDRTGQNHTQSSRQDRTGQKGWDWTERTGRMGLDREDGTGRWNGTERMGLMGLDREDETWQKRMGQDRTKPYWVINRFTIKQIILDPSIGCRERCCIYSSWLG